MIFTIRMILFMAQAIVDFAVALVLSRLASPAGQQQNSNLPNVLATRLQRSDLRRS